MKFSLVCIASFLSLMAVEQTGRATDLKTIQGEWVGVDGDAKIRVWFEKDMIDFRSAATGEWYEAKFELNSNSKPKEISATITDSPVKELNGLTTLGIYRLSGNRLTVTACRPGEPDGPKNFEDSRCRTLELKRP